MNWLSHNKVKILSTLTLVSLLFCVPQITIAYDGETVINEILWTVVVGLFGKVLWAAGLLLNFTVENFVIGFGAYYASSGIGSAIDTLWGSVRDIINLTFIFGLVYIGFKMILDSSDSSAKRMLGSLLIAAILINFSLFITKTVVDFSNIAAKQFAGQFEDKTTESKTDYDVSGKFTELLGVQKTFSEKDLGEGGAIGYILGTMWLIAVASFVFVAGGILLLIRFVVLNIYLLLSPVMFLGFIFPGVGDTFKKYWSGFLGRAFFAPAYLLMIYFSYNILVKLEAGLRLEGSRSDNFLALSGSDPVAATQSFEGMIIYFILVCVFLIASLVVANKMGAHGASSAIAVGKRWSNNIRRGAQRTITYAPRVGSRWAANYTGNKLQKKFNEFQAKNYNSRTGKAFAYLAKTNLVDKAVRGSTQAMKDAQFGTGTTNEKEAAYKRATLARANKTAKEAEANKNIQEGISGSEELAQIREMQKNGVALSPEQIAKVGDLERAETAMLSALASITADQLSDLSDSDIEKIAPHLTHSQVENFMKNDKIDNIVKAKINSSRVDNVTKKITRVDPNTGNSVPDTKAITNLSTEEIESLGADWINKNIHTLSHDQVENIKKSKHFTESQKDNFVSTRSTKHANVVNGGVQKDFEDLFEHTETKNGNTIKTKRKPSDIANLGATILLDPRAVPLLTVKSLEHISKNETLTATERDALARNIRHEARASLANKQLLKPLLDYLDSSKVQKNGF